VSIDIESISVWINAFLPRDIAGRTTTLRDGPCAGKTAIMGPVYYLTDQRSFSPHRRASARMQSCLTVDFTASAPAVAQQHRCDPTIMSDPLASVPGQARASTSRMTAVASALAPTVVIRLDAVASHPFPTLTSLANDIAYRGDIVVDRATRMVRVDLMVQLFPAFEGYASINQGPAAILFHHAPPPGVTELRLLDVPQRRIRGTLRDSDGDGVFDSPLALEIAAERPESVSERHDGEGQRQAPG
jgi:hypothetical protein